MGVAEYHFEKRKSMGDIKRVYDENFREKGEGQYHNAVDVSRSDSNYIIKDIDIDKLEEEYKKILGKATIKRNSVLALDNVYYLPESFKFSKDLSPLERKCINKYFEKCVEFNENKYGVSLWAVVHHDETRPHLHIMSVPLTDDGRLCAKALTGNKIKLRSDKDEFYETVSKKFGFDERNKTLDNNEIRKHVSCNQHLEEKRMQLEKDIINKQNEINELTEQIENYQMKLKKLDNQTSALWEQSSEIRAKISAKYTSLGFVYENAKQRPLNPMEQKSLIQELIDYLKDIFGIHDRERLGNIAIYYPEAERKRIIHEIEKEKEALVDIHKQIDDISEQKNDLLEEYSDLKSVRKETRENLREIKEEYEELEEEWER